MVEPPEVELIVQHLFKEFSKYSTMNFQEYQQLKPLKEDWFQKTNYAQVICFSLLIVQEVEFLTWELYTTFRTMMKLNSFTLPPHKELQLLHRKIHIVQRDTNTLKE